VPQLVLQAEEAPSAVRIVKAMASMTMTTMSLVLEVAVAGLEAMAEDYLASSRGSWELPTSSQAKTKTGKVFAVAL